jgi:L-ascorbate metabolism protein UlaG (beta-lactamase superfamily)
MVVALGFTAFASACLAQVPEASNPTPVRFGSQAVGSAQTQTPVTFTITTGGALDTKPLVLTTGAPNLDYTLCTGSTCTGSVSAGTCTVNVVFTPKAPGLRFGAVVLTSGGATVATALLNGTGTGAAVVFPGTTATTTLGGYFDPACVEADLVLCTHEHLDHMDIDALPVFAKASRTHFAGLVECMKRFADMGLPRERCHLLEEGVVYTHEEVTVTPVFADHGKLAPDALGLVVAADGVTIYHTGDTSLRLDRLDAVRALKPDVVLPCINGEYGNMDARQAAEMIRFVEAPNSSAYPRLDVRRAERQSEAVHGQLQGVGSRDAHPSQQARRRDLDRSLCMISLLADVLTKAGERVECLQNTDGSIALYSSTAAGSSDCIRPPA